MDVTHFDYFLALALEIILEFLYGFFVQIMGVNPYDFASFFCIYCHFCIVLVCVYLFVEPSYHFICYFEIQ